jgi:hypothetical protein
MREDKFDGEEETAGEENPCEGESQGESETSSEEGSEEDSKETCCEKSCHENCQETLCHGSEASGEKTGGQNGISPVVQTRVSSPRQETHAVVHG